MKQEPLPLQNRAKHLNEATRRKGKPGRVSATDLTAILLIYGEQCFYCHRQISFDYDYSNGTFDHIVPLHRGGRTTKRNLVPCCDRCNYIKDSRAMKYSNGSISFVDP